MKCSLQLLTIVCVVRCLLLLQSNLAHVSASAVADNRWSAHVTLHLSAILVAIAACTSAVSFSSTPYSLSLCSIGNHERDWPGSGSATGGTDSGGECGIAIARRFHMPNTQMNKPPMQTWWSTDFGPVHFTVISTELSFNTSSEQYAFVKKDWESVDRTKTPFLILAGHRSATYQQLAISAPGHL